MWRSRKYKQSHTPFTFCFCQYTKNIYQANRAFIQGITSHEACSERDTTYIFASMHTLALRAFTLHAVVVFLLLGDGASSSDGPREAPQSARPVQYLWGLAMFNSASLMSGLCLTCADASQWYAWWIRKSSFEVAYLYIEAISRCSCLSCLVLPWWCIWHSLRSDAFIWFALQNQSFES